MINTLSLNAVDGSRFSKTFIKPLYDSYCFSNIPQTIKNILLQENKQGLPNDVFGSLPQQYNKVIFFLVDGFGWEFLQKYLEKYEFLKYINQHGVISKLTTQFPSTTPAEITTLYTGLPVGQHGVYEWNYFEPKIDAIISPLLFSFAGNVDGKRVRDNLVAAEIDPKSIFPTKTVFSDLKMKGVPSYAFINSEYANSPYGNVLFRDANIISWNTFEEACQLLTEKVLADHEKGYYYVYFGDIDSAAHKYGPNSQEFQSAVHAFLTAMENLFLKKLQGKLDNTLFSMTADHGQVAIDPQTTIYINKEYPQLVKWLKRNRQGELLVAAGACRDLFLHIKDEYLIEAQTFLQGALYGKAEIYRVSDLIDQGFFGPNVSSVFLNRVGNLVIICTGNNSVWWYEQGRFEIIYRGHHGGLTPAEAETYFACYPY